MAENKQGTFRTTIGGQALIEGILMRGPEKDAIVVRAPEGLVTKVTERKFIKDKFPILGWPIIRGMATFLSSIVTGVKALMFSADYFPDDENAQPSKFDQWLEKHVPAEKLQSVLVAFSVVLSLGMTLTAGEYLVAAPLADYLRRHPELHVAVRSGGTSELLALLNAGEIDCAFVEGFFDKNAYAWDVFRTERLVCVCAADHEFAARPVRVEDLFDERLIVREPGSGTRAVLEHALAAQNLTVDGCAQASVVESLDVIKILVEHDLGISFLYEAAVARELAAGTLRVIDLEGLAILHDIAFIRLKNSVFEREFQNLFADL